MNTNLEEIIVGKAKTARANIETSTAVQEVQKLLEYGTLRDAEILRNLGLNSIHAKMEKEHGDLIVLNKIQTATEFSVIKMEQIQEVCEEFRLRYLPVNLYKGYYPPTITAKIKKLEKEKTEQLRLKNPIALDFTFDNTQLQRDFKIMAPAKLLVLQKEKKPEVELITTKIAQNLKAFFEQEPLLFYQEDEDHAILLEKWGNDFTIFRRVLGFVTTNFKRFFTTALVLNFVLATLLFSVLGCSWALAIGIGVFASFVISSIICPGERSIFYTKNNWNSNIKF